MNTKRGRSAFLAVCIGLTFAATGCGSVHEPHAESSGASDHAVMCDRCKTTWVVRSEPVGKLVRYTREKKMVCPDCESAVLHWMKTGELKHACSHCGGRMTCEQPHSVRKK